MNFEKQPLTREVARGLRAATRKAVALDGHRFIYNDLKELWSSEDGAHLLCTHEGDVIWQYWHYPPEGTARLVCCFPTRREAEAAAALTVTGALPAKALPGIYLLAWSPGGRTIRVQCRSGDPSIQQGIFERLGYETSIEEVA